MWSRKSKQAPYCPRENDYSGIAVNMLFRWRTGSLQSQFQAVIFTVIDIAQSANAQLCK